jgi:uncharacterized protein (DUF433 family)
MDWKKVITTDPAILDGKPVITGTRLSVEHVIELLGNGWSEQDVVRHYEVTLEQVQACLAYAHDLLADVLVHSLPDTSVGR